MAHPLSGADIGTLIQAFQQGGRPDDWWATAAIWGAVLGRTPFSALERVLIDHRLPKTSDLPPPVFILGHWRSGTTHLYNTMSRGAFGYVPPVAVGLPWDMFGIAAWLRPLLERALPEHRWIDRIPVTPTSPQEDEIGLASMTPLSFYHGIYFPRRFEELIMRGLFFDDCSEAEIASWEARFTYFLRKLAHQQGQQLLIKNPVYTGRVDQLRRIFPDAKFIHIHRDPVDVFLSMRNFYTRLLDVMALQKIPANLDIDAVIFSAYDRMMRNLIDDTRDLAAPQFVELPYSTLDHDPLGALKTIYDTLDLDGFAAAEPDFTSYLSTVQSFQKNRFAIERETCDAISRNWGDWISHWGYNSPETREVACR